MKTLISLLTLLVLGGFMVSKSGAFEKSVNAKTDTLKVPFTYWFPSGGPFTGLCGNPYSLVFTGTVSKLYSPKGPFPTGRNVGEVFYSPQTGIILINDIKYKTAPTEGYSKKQGHTYDGEGYFISDCFNDLKLKEGDKVIAFVYSYEGEYCIPGNSILKLNNFKDSIVGSIEKYIKNNQDPLSIRSDTTLWAKYGLDYALKQIIECRLSTKKEK